MTIDKLSLTFIGALLVLAHTPSWTQTVAPVIKPVYKPFLNPQPLPQMRLPQSRRLLFLALPPEQFDHEYEGDLEVIRTTEAVVKEKCSGKIGYGQRPVGCTFRYFNGESCVVYIINDSELAARGFGAKEDYELILRHELGHCNGWKHGINGP